VRAYYRVGSGPFVYRDELPSDSVELTIAPTEVFTFGVSTKNQQIGLTIFDSARLDINGFTATPVTPVTAPLVPAPLPAIGAASLFLGSRRLKKRMVQQRVLRLARRNLAPAIRSILPG